MATKARSAARPTSGAAVSERGDDAPATQTPRVHSPAEQLEHTPRETTATLRLPFVTAYFHAPGLSAPKLPNGHQVAEATRPVWSLLPSPKETLYFGGLAITAIAGLIEWPVAAAIGVGTALARQGRPDPEPKPRNERAGKGDKSAAMTTG